ncbi:rCG62800, partial [Rattus norvegicus]
MLVLSQNGVRKARG